jgi:hypothetical protein
MTDTQTAAPGSDARGAASDGWSSDPDSPATTLRPGIPGHISIAPKVLQKVGSAVVAETLAVERSRVHVDARDDEGRLALRVSTPIAIPELTADVVVADGGVLGTVRALQQTVTTRIHDITGRAVSRVDVTVSASRPQSSTTTGRVR